jgi:hypothetical protein
VLGRWPSSPCLSLTALLTCMRQRFPSGFSRHNGHAVHLRTRTHMCTEVASLLSNSTLLTFTSHLTKFASHPKALILSIFSS